MTWYEKWAEKCRKTGRARLIHDRVSNLPYLERFYILPRWATLGLFRMVIHRFWASDDECDGLHDHPWPYCTIILSGGYTEYRHNKPPRAAVPGSIIFAKARHLHRVKLLNENQVTWTLFIMGPRIRKWGFLVGEPARWVHWKTWCDFRYELNQMGMKLSKKQIWTLFNAKHES